MSVATDPQHVHHLELHGGNGQVMRLRCAECGTPFAEVQHGALVIRSKHHGAIHINALPLPEIVRLLAGPEDGPPAIDSG